MKAAPKIIKPVKNSMYNVSNIDGVRYSTKMPLNFISLNEHKFRHEFDCLALVAPAVRW